MAQPVASQTEAAEQLQHSGKLKTYFCGSIRGVAPDKSAFRAMIGHCKAKYGPVLTEHVGNDTPEEKVIPAQEIYERDVAWLKESDWILSDVSAPSLGVGYELAFAEAAGKKHILCLFRGDLSKCSAMLTGNKSLTCKGYNTIEEALSLIDSFLKERGLTAAGAKGKS